jgi:hypothetical protein
MLGFLIGLFTGFSLGVFAMCLLRITGTYDEDDND